MKQKKSNLTNRIDAWMQGVIGKEEFLSLKEQVDEASLQELDEEIIPVWNTYIEKMIQEKKQPRLPKALHKNMYASLHSKYRRVQLAAVLIPFLLTISFSVAYYLNQDEVRSFEIYTLKGEKSFLNLPDQSKVWINGESCLTYASDFDVKQRNISLQGESFFDIAHQDGKPFTLSVDNIDIVVRGTKFNVKNNSDEVEVALLKGKVDLYYNKDQFIASLKPNQVIHVDKLHPNQFRIETTNTKKYAVWIYNKLMIDKENIVEIAHKLEKWYGVNIRLSNITDNHTYTFTIKTESLNETLNLLNQLLPIEYSLNGEEVIIKQK